MGTTIGRADGCKTAFRSFEISGEHLILAGNSIKMQNGFGAWRRVAYVCMYNVVTKFAVAVAED